MKLRRFVLGLSTFGLATVVGISLLGGVAGAQTPTPGQAEQTSPRPVRFTGRVDSVGQNSIALTTRRGQVTANVSQRTWILVQAQGQRRCSEGTISDLRTGLPAEVAGMTTNQQNVVDARVIVQGRCGLAPVAQKARNAVERLARHVAEGTIKSINGSNITLTPRRGTAEITVVTSADTVVLNSGFKGVSSLKVGDSVQVLGQPVRPTATPGSQPGNQGRTVNAWAIRVVATNSALVIGRVESVNGNTLTLKTPAHRQGMTVTLDSSTGYKSLSVVDGRVSLVSASQADVRAGSNLIIEGTTGVNPDALSAKAVIILPGKGASR
jgi:hypothetical protein